MRCRIRKADLFASLVVFLVALPLCVGVAIASGVPAELGLVTGIVGGLVAGVRGGRVAYLALYDRSALRTAAAVRTLLRRGG